MTHLLNKLPDGKFLVVPADGAMVKIVSQNTGRRLAIRPADKVAFMLQVAEGDAPVVDQTYVEKEGK